MKYITSVAFLFALACVVGAAISLAVVPSTLAGPDCGAGCEYGEDCITFPKALNWMSCCKNNDYCPGEYVIYEQRGWCETSGRKCALTPTGCWEGTGCP